MKNLPNFFLNGAFGTELWALRAQNIAPPTAKILVWGQYWGQRPQCPQLNSPLVTLQYMAHTTEPVPPIFWRLGGGQDFVREAPKFGAEGTVLENLVIFLKNCFLEMPQKAKLLYIGYRFFFEKYFSKLQ